MENLTVATAKIYSADDATKSWFDADISTIHKSGEPSSYLTPSLWVFHQNSVPSFSIVQV